ncbi:hypothetical protein BVC80_375g4 [Macleaya cordata]|uniref:Protein kinase domain n=1 Tax=Macleaya cordata TaxID=56857 RepID=A0A200QT29_MACCD|nr:hypothetical protein BVC80_375g4 [Macleaya cordata]
MMKGVAKVVGTLGYLAPELTRTGMRLGFSCLEVACWRSRSHILTRRGRGDGVGVEAWLYLFNVLKARPTMRQVMQYFSGDAALLQTDLWSLDTSHMISFLWSQSLEDFADMAYTSLSPVESLLSGPRCVQYSLLSRED